MLKTEESQPVEPAPVETIIPLDDCGSIPSPTRAIPRGNVRLATDKEVVERQHPLAIIQADFGQGNRPYLRSVLDSALHCLPGLADLEWQKHAVDPLRIGIDSHNRQFRDVLGSIGYEAVTADDHHGDATPEIESGQVRSLNELQGIAQVQFFLEALQRVPAPRVPLARNGKGCLPGVLVSASSAASRCLALPPRTRGGPARS